MATLTLRPNAGGTHTELHYYDGSIHNPDVNVNYTMVDEAVKDDTSTLVGEWGTAPIGYEHDTYNVPNHTTETGTINSVKVIAYVRDGASATHRYYKCVVRSDGTTTDGTEQDLSGDTNNFIEISQQWNTNPADSQAWEWADIDALEIGIGSEKKNAASPEITQVYVVVDYTPPGAGRSYGFIIG